MATTILSDIPDQITAGDSVAWKRSFGDYSAADGWTLSYAFTKTGSLIAIEGSADGADHLIEVAASASVDWAAGEYAFQAYVTKGDERYQVDDGIVEIRPNLAAATGGLAALPPCFEIRDAIEAVLQERATEAQTSLAIGGRQISEMSHMEIMDALARAKAQCEVWKRKNRRSRGRKTGQTVKVAFTE
jgi:hypothetical protein